MIKHTPNMKYTDMCIFVDANILNKDADQSLVYDYMVQIAYMLIRKHHFFEKEVYNENYAYYLANIVYMRMVDKRQFLPEDDPKYITPILSCLNYMKTILYPRKIAFAQEEFGFTTKADDVEANETSYQYASRPIRSYENSLRAAETEAYIISIPATLTYVLRKCKYKKDKVIMHNLRISILLSFVSNLTFNATQTKRLTVARKSKNIERFEGLLESFYSTNTNTATVLYGLDHSFETLVHVYLQRFKKEISKDIEELCADNDMSDETIKNIMMSNVSDIVKREDA